MTASAAARVATTPQNVQSIELTLCTFSDEKGTTPKRHVLPWSKFVQRFSHHESRSTKEGTGCWSPVSYKPRTTRGKANVDRVYALVLDVDHADLPRDRLDGLAWIAHTTYRHSPTAPRWRVVIPLAKPVAGDEDHWPEVWQRAHARFGACMDEQCKDASRIYFLPSCPPDSEPQVESHDGAPLDPDSLPPVPKLAPSPRRTPKTAPGSIGQYAAKALDDELAAVSSAGEGQRNSQLNRSAFALGQLVGGGELNRDQVEDRLEEAAAASGLVEDTGIAAVRRTIKSGLDRGELEPRSRPLPNAGVVPHMPSPPTTNGHVVPVEDETAPRRFPRTDAGNGEHFADLYGDRLRYDHNRKRWLLWRQSQHRWEPDPLDEVRQLAKHAARARYHSAVDIEDLAERDKEAKFAIASEARARMDAMLVQAASEAPIADSGKTWDEDEWLLGVTNGVINLQTCQLRAGTPEDKITRQIPLHYDPTAQAPRWRQFLDEVFGSDQELVSFIQIAVGYSLTGVTREQCLILCHGTGSNGKSTLLRTLRMIAGPYGHNMPFTALEPVTRTLNDLADLQGKRLVTASESNEAVRLNEARVKALTGDENITGRQLYERAVEFRPQAKLWLSTNHKPPVRDDSHGFWRRIRLVPFTQQFDPHAEPHLEDTLQSEAAGILAWAIDGVRQWLEHGLPTPKAVAEATSTYRKEQDILQNWIDDDCVQAPNVSAGSNDLYQDYVRWSQREGYSEKERLSLTMFGRRMVERFERKTTRDGKLYLGIAIRHPGSASQSTLAVEGVTSSPQLPSASRLIEAKLLDKPSQPVTGNRPVCAGCGEPANSAGGMLIDIRGDGVLLHQVGDCRLPAGKP